MNDVLFYASLIVHYTMLAGVVYSIYRPNRRIWPPPNKQSWQYYGTWFLICAAVLLTVTLALLTWDTSLILTEMRYLIGIPLSLIGGIFVTWGIATLGIKNTFGSAGGLIEKGPYQFTRNPQYLGDIVFFLGFALVANSLYVAILLIMHSIVFVITPLSEELWLEEQYGHEYNEYKSRTPRFL